METGEEERALDKIDARESQRESGISFICQFTKDLFADATFEGAFVSAAEAAVREASLGD